MAFSFKKLLVTLIPNGTYKATVSKMEFVQSTTNPANYNCKVTLTIAEGTYAKRTILDTISTAYSSKLSKFLTATGVDMNKEYDSMEELYKAGIKAAKDKEVMIKVSSKSYQGNDYNQIDEYNPIPGSTTSAADVLKEFGTAPDLKPQLDTEVEVTVEEAPKAVNADAPVADNEPIIDVDLNILK